MPEIYPQTLWSEVIARLFDPDPEVSHEAWQRLLAMYRAPIEAVLRHRLGHLGEPVEELVEEFFSEVVLRGLLVDVGPGKGRFRAFIQACIGTFVKTRRRDHGRSREERLPEEEFAATGPTSIEQYDALDGEIWFASLLNEAVVELAAGRTEDQARAIALRYGLPVLEGDPGRKQSVAECAAALDKNSRAIEVLLGRARSSLRRVLEGKVAESVQSGDSEAGFEDLYRAELRAMYRAFQAHHPWILEGRNNG